MVNDQRIENPDILAARIRWLAVATGCFVFGSTLVFGAGGALVEPGLLALGAIVQPHSTGPGKWLMWVSALMTSAWMSQTDSVLLREAIKAGHISLPLVAIFLAPVLVLLCDVALVMDALVPRRSHGVRVQSGQNRLDWVIWLAALALTAYYLRISMPYRLNGHLDVTGIAFTSVALFFDVALLAHAVKG